MTIDDAINLTPNASDATIAATVNADPSRYRPVTSAAGLEWIAGNGRLAKIEGAINAMATSTDPQAIGLRNALRVLLLALQNSTSYLTLDPTSDQRTLLTASVSSGVITQDDADALLAKATIGQDVTAADVAARRAALARDAAVRTWSEDKLYADAAASAVIDADPANADVEAVVTAYATALRARRAPEVAE